MYKGKIEPCNHLLNFATFIAYFPQLVAGPIERASQLLTQISANRQWRRDYAVEGLRMVLVGVLKKVCISNMLALYADQYFLKTGDPITALKAGMAFTLQIYVDFSAYSEIARGVSRLLGIELMANFRFPLFSRNIIEFWQRWHISLMWWFRDYVYIPLGGSRRGSRRTIINIALVFILSGMWHGAAWNYVLWGAYWAVAYIVGKALLHLPKRNESIAIIHLPSMILTLGIVSFGFYVFRCEDGTQLMNGLHSAIYYVAFFGLSWLIARCLFYNRLTIRITQVAMSLCLVAWMLRYIILWQTAMADWWLIPALLVFALEWHNRNADYPTAHISDKRYLCYAFYWVCMLAVLISENEGTSFIYFQF
ncbi:MAG: MBOAT family O-acyltransferase [Muribaculaceae bacterium]